MKTLLKSAKSIPDGKNFARRYTKAEIELALAFTKSEVSLSQVARAIDTTRSNLAAAYRLIANALRQHYTK